MQTETTESESMMREEINVKIVELKRTFSVPIERLYESWANPQIFAQWWKGLIIKKMNSSQGGAYRFEWEGTPEDYAEGQYEELTPYSKIVFTWNTAGTCAGEDRPITDTRVTLKFSAIEDSKSELTLRHEGFTTEAQHKAHLEGWTSCLHDLARAIDFKVVVTRQFAAPIAKVFEAWTNPEFMKRWFSPGNWKVEVARVEAHQDGKYFFQLKGTENQIWGVHGKYLSVKPDKQLSFTWNTEGEPPVRDTIVDVVFHALDSSLTEVTVTHSGFLSKSDADEHEWGWNACEDQLVKALV